MLNRIQETLLKGLHLAKQQERDDLIPGFLKELDKAGLVTGNNLNTDAQKFYDEYNAKVQREISGEGDRK